MGATPLYDAIGMGIAKINAVTTKDDNVLVTIITDGYENCSTEYNLRMIKNLIKKLNLDVEAMAMDMGIDNHLQFQEDEAGTKKMKLAPRRCLHARIVHAKGSTNV